jgi:phosphopantothenoylcysteine decarboxylase/phosphopantothenate--cysteine ligase
LKAPPGVEIVRIGTAAEMRDAVIPRAREADVVIMAAAVADYAPASAADQKIHKNADELHVTLVRTPDILAELGASRGSAARPLLVGFSAETAEFVQGARRKLREKRADLVVANDVSRADAGFESENNEVVLVSGDGEETLPLQPKAAIAAQIVQRIEQLLGRSAPAARR